MALSKIDAANFLTGTIPQGNVANASLGAVTSLPGAIATGKVLQVVSAVRSTEITTSSQSYVTTNCTASITPSSSSNKILIQISGSGRQNDDGGTAKFTVYRDSTDLAAGTPGFSEISVTGGTYVKAPYVITFLDSPSSTSAVAYTLYMKNQTSTTCRACHNNTDTTVTLLEVAG
jgi:hypothetical protein